MVSMLVRASSTAERFNSPSATENLYFRAEILAPMPASLAASKRGRTRSTSTPSGRGRVIVPSRFALRFFFRAATLSSGREAPFFLFRQPTTFVGSRLNGRSFRDDRLFQRNEFSPKREEKKNGGKKERPMGRERRSMAYCAVSHVA